MKRYGVAVISVGVAFAIRHSMSRMLGEELPFTLFIAAALVAAWYGGAVTGIVALMLGLLVADYFFVGPPHAFRMGAADAWFHIVRYVFTASLGIGLIEVLHRARRRAEAALEETRAEAAMREQSEAELRAAHELLQRHAADLDGLVGERTAALRGTVASLHEILYNIAHCLRAPIRAVSSYSQIFLEECGPQLNGAGRDYIGKVREAAARMDALTQDLLEYGNVAQKALIRASVPLDEAVKAAMTRLRARIEKTGAEVRIDGELPSVNADFAIVEQVFFELLDNAIKFARTGTRPTVRISAERTSSTVRLRIEDDGIGMEPRYADRIFGVFERLHPSEHEDGTGIGLAIVRRGMQRHGGNAGVESAPGAGSKFWLVFPGRNRPRRADRDA